MVVKEICDQWVKYVYEQWVENWLRSGSKSYLRDSTRNMVKRMKEASTTQGRAEEARNLMERLKRLSDSLINNDDVANEARYKYEKPEIYMECALVAYDLGDLQEALNLLQISTGIFSRRSLHKAVSYWLCGCIQWQLPSHSEDAVLSWERSLQTISEVEQDTSRNDVATANKVREVAELMKNAIGAATRDDMPPPPPTDGNIVQAPLSEDSAWKKTSEKSENLLEEDLNIGFIEIDRQPKTETDRPFGVDRLNYSKYAQSFTKIILNHETSTPITFGIYGQWGQGKSFLMRKIRETLDDSRRKEKSFPLSTFWKRYRLMLNGNIKSIVGNYRNLASEQKKNREEKIDFHVVEFNAWAYVGTDHLWASLVTHLYQEAEKYFGLKLHIARLWMSIKKSLPKSFLIFVFYALLGAGISLLVSFNEIRTNWDSLKIIVNAFAGSIIGGSAIASLPTMFSTLKEFSDNLILTPKNYKI